MRWMFRGKLEGLEGLERLEGLEGLEGGGRLEVRD